MFRTNRQALIYFAVLNQNGQTAITYGQQTMIANLEPMAGASQDFARLTDLQQRHSKASNDLDALEVKMNELSQKSASVFATDYVVLQEELTSLDTKIKLLFEKNPEWRGPNKSVKTPFGEVSQRTVTELEVANPAVTVTLIEARAKEDPKFKAEDFLRVAKSPNLEALEGLSDDELAKLGVSRKKREQVTVKPAKVSVAKTVKAAKGKVVPS